MHKVKRRPQDIFSRGNLPESYFDSVHFKPWEALYILDPASMSKLGPTSQNAKNVSSPILPFN